MKILIVNTFYYPNMKGGTEQSVKLLAEGLVKRGHEVFVLTGDNSDITEENGVRIIRLNLKTQNESLIRKLSRKALEFNNISISNKINEILDDVKPDIVHTNNLFYISTIIWRIAKEKNMKVIHTLRDYWGLCPKTTLLKKSGSICGRGKGICSVHKYNYNLRTKYVDIVTSPSKFTLNLYKKNNIFESTIGVVIPNAIDFNIDERKQLLKDRFNRTENIITFLFIGTLDIHKGVEILIEAFKQVKSDNIRLNICGDGPLKSYIEENAKLDKRIKYLGKVLKKEKEEILISSDVMIVPSIWYEPFGRVVIEAYKYGLPVIACKIGGIKELLDDKNSIGILPGNEKELKLSIEKLSNREDLKEYIVYSKNLFESYRIENQLKKFEEIYIN